VDGAVKIIVDSAWTGNIGDGKIFISTINSAVKIRTGEQGESII
jgi:nitrogen regulatory protein P-II 1